jgi:hypothetical protein
MSLLFDKLATAEPRHPCCLAGQPIVCRGCSCDDSARRYPELEGRAIARQAEFVLLDLDGPYGLCGVCAERVGWHRFFFSSPDFLDGEGAA